MAAGSIVIDLLMKTGSFETDTKRAEKRLKELEKTAVQAGKIIGGAFVAGAGALAVMVKASIDTADAMAKAAQSAGVTVEAFSGLAYAAELSGVAQEELTSSLVRLSRTASDADKGIKTAAEAFAALDIKVQAADGTLKASDQLLAEVAERFARMEDGARKTALATELFGKSGAKLIPLLNSGAIGIAKMTQEARDLGIVIGPELGKKSEEFNDTISKIFKAGGGIGIKLAAELLEPMQAIASAILDIAKNGDEAGGVITRIGTAFRQTAVIGAATVFVVGGMVREVRNLAVQVGQLYTILQAPPGQILSSIRELSKMAGDAQRERAQALQDYLSFRNDVLYGRAPELPGIAGAMRASIKPTASTEGQLPKPSGGKSEAEKAAEAAQRYIDTLVKEKESIFAVTEAEKVLLEIRSGALKGATKAQKDYALALRAEIDSTQAVIDDARKRSDARNAEYEQINQFVDAQKEASKNRLTSLLSNTAQAQLDSVLSDVRFLNEQFDAGNIKNVEQWADAVREATGRLGRETENTRNIAEELGLTFSSAFEDAIVGGKSLRDVLRGLEQDILRLVTRDLVTEPLAKFITGNISGAGGFNLGNIFSSIFGGARADGGDVMAGKAYLVGERGPEMFVPRTQGAVLPSGQTLRTLAGASSGMRGGVTINQMFAPGTDRRTIAQAAYAAQTAVARGARIR
jgi:hypothetical protein